MSPTTWAPSVRPPPSRSRSIDAVSVDCRSAISALNVAMAASRGAWPAAHAAPSQAAKVCANSAAPSSAARMSPTVPRIRQVIAASVARPTNFSHSARIISACQLGRDRRLAEQREQRLEPGCAAAAVPGSRPNTMRCSGPSCTTSPCGESVAGMPQLPPATRAGPKAACSRVDVRHAVEQRHEGGVLRPRPARSNRGLRPGRRPCRPAAPGRPARRSALAARRAPAQRSRRAGCAPPGRSAATAPAGAGARESSRRRRPAPGGRRNSRRSRRRPGRGSSCREASTSAARAARRLLRC